MPLLLSLPAPAPLLRARVPLQLPQEWALDALSLAIPTLGLILLPNVVSLEWGSKENVDERKWDKGFCIE